MMSEQSAAGYDASKYPHPSVTVDVVVFGMFGALDGDDGAMNGVETGEQPELRVLLIRRRNWPFQGCWAIPGGFVNMQESLDDAARRELEEETGLRDVYLEQLYTFGAPKRDPRTRVISVSYYALLPAHEHEPRGGDDASEARWFPVSDLPPLAFDHAQILDVALRRLRAKAGYAGIAREFLPPTFTLRRLRHIYETVLGRTLDRANFTRHMLMEGDIEETGEIDRGGAHRPAKLYRFRKDRMRGTRDKE
jgi:8-oxo-dGTP diphosphatase